MKRPPTVDILRALDDPKLFRSVLRDPATWRPWRAFLAALFALPMTDTERALYRECTDRATAPAAAFTEGWLCCGRRAGKSFVLAIIAVFLAAFRDWRPFLGPGERATIMVIATDRKQARVIFRYVRGLLSIPILRPLIERETTEIIDLKNAVSIEIAAASYRTSRGYTIAAVLCDEIAFWDTEGAAEPDYSILDALRPGLGTLPGAMLLCASSPYAQSGALFDAFRRYHGRDDAPVLVWKAPTRVMNATFPQATFDAAMERDAANASSEYGAIFRTDVQAFVAREAIDSCVSRGVYERQPIAGCRYVGFCDPSGGQNDAMTMAVAHREGDIVVLDCLRSRKPPFSPDSVVAEFASVFKVYGVHRIEGDRYAGQWPVEAFRKQRVEYVAAAKTKSDIYVSLLPAINSRRCDLLDDARLISELAGLERRTARGGRDSIDHRPGFHDDTVNAAAGAIVALFEQAGPVVIPQELLGRIMQMPARRNMGSARRTPQMLFRPTAEQLAPPASWNPQNRQRSY